MKRRVLTWAISFSVGFGLSLSLLLFWRVGFAPVLDAFRYASWPVIAAYVGVSVLISVALTVKWSVVLNAYKVTLPLFTLFTYRLIGFAVSYVTPSAHVGGEPVRALLLGKQGIPLKVGFATAIVDRSVELLFNVLFFFVGALIIANVAAYPVEERAATLLVSMLLVALAAILIYLLLDRRKILVPLLERVGAKRLPRWRSLRGAISETELLIEHFFANRPKGFFMALAINLLLWVLMYLEYRFALLLLGYNADLLSVFVFLTGVGIAYSIPVPAALGVLELGQITAATILGVQPALAVALALIIRARDILWTIIGLILLSILHLNVFRLYDRSVEAAKQHNFAMLRLELRALREAGRKS